MTDRTRRIAICHLLLRGTRWMPVSVNRKLGPNDRCAPGGAVVSAVLCAVVEGDAVLGWTENSGFMVREIGADSTLAPLDLELSLKVGDGENRKGGISWGCLTTPLLH